MQWSAKCGGAGRVTGSCPDKSLKLVRRRRRRKFIQSWRRRRKVYSKLTRRRRRRRRRRKGSFRANTLSRTVTVSAT